MLCRAPTDLRAADLWSAGCILHEMLLGRVPFELGPDPTDWAGAAAATAAATCDTAMEAARAVGCDTTTVSVARMLCGEEGGGGRGGGGNAEPRIYYPQCGGGGGAAPPPAASPLDPLSAQVVGSTLHRDPSMRPTARQLLGHPYWLMRTAGGGGGDAGAGISTAGTSPASSAQLGMLTVGGGGGGGAAAEPVPLLLPQLEAAPARSQLLPGAASAHLALPPGAASPALGGALLVLADGGGVPMDLPAHPAHPAHPAEGALVALSGGAGWPSHATARHVMQLDRLGHHQWPHTLDGLDPHGDLRWIQAAAMFASGGGGVGAGGRCLSWTDAQRQSARRGSWCSSGEDDDDGGGGGVSDDDDGCGGRSGMDHPALLMDLGGSSDEDVPQWSRDSV
eukprot:COSAG01_NODE_6537_length_3616_cov_1.546204_4_plen_394_part_00